MMKLKKITICDSKSLTKLEREQYIIPEEYKGRVVLETWDINDSIRYKSVAVNSEIRNYLLTLGDFKDVPIEEDIKIDYMRKSRLCAGMEFNFNDIKKTILSDINKAKENDILRVEMKTLSDGSVDIEKIDVNTSDDWLNEAFGYEKKVEKETSKEEEFRKNTQKQAEQLKSILDDVLLLNKDIKHVSNNDMTNIYQKIVQHEKEFPFNNNKSQNILKEMEISIKEMEVHKNNK